MQTWRLALVLCFAFALPLLGCATPSPVYHLAPSFGDVTWDAGRASAQQQLDGVQVAIAYSGQGGDTLGLQVQISNASAERLELSAKDVTFTACTGTANASCAPTAWVMDPEVELAMLDQRARQQQSSARASQGLLTFLVVLNAVADVGSIASGHAHHRTGLGTAAAVGMMESNAASNDSARSKLDAERDFWANTALRRNTVDTGQTAAGVVLVPLYPTARYLWLHVRVGARQFSFRFDQTRTMPAV